MKLLSLNPATVTRHKAVAWFIPGASGSTWVREVSNWEVEMSEVVFYPVHHGLDRVVEGALAVPGQLPRRSPSNGRLRSYGCPAPGVYVPIDSFVWPPVEVTDWASAKTVDVWVWHPTAGLQGYESGDALRAWDLLVAPMADPERWNLARWIEPTNVRLRRVDLEIPLTLAEVFGAESDEIGSRSPDLLPPLAAESWAPLAVGVMLAPFAWLGRAILWLFSFLPRTAIAPTWINDLENWIGRRLGRMVAGLSQRQKREINRLLQMLQERPIEGLRHAISLSDLANRGAGRSTGSLGRRSLDFNLGRLGGGGSANVWELGPDVRLALAKRYRELAESEKALGQYRRSACIYAELLGDFPAAAEALRGGRCHREAALLYRDRLNNPLAAASCLAEGGFIDEAIAIYERDEHWQEVALLWEKENRPDQARLAWEREIARLEAKKDTLAAARLIASKLTDSDRALRLLESTWPKGEQALECLEGRFSLLHRRSQRLAVRRLVRGLAEEELPAPIVVPLIGLLAKLHDTWLDRECQRDAAESLRCRASRLLTDGVLTRADEMRILRSLIRLSPEDRLLKRDTVRFRKTRPRSPTLTPRGPETPSLRRITLKKSTTISLPRVGKWVSVIGDADGFHAVARQGEAGWFFSRGIWSGAVHSTSWKPMDTAPARPLLACFDSEVIVSVPFGPRLNRAALPSSSATGADVWHAGTPTWLPNDVVKLSATSENLWAVRWVDAHVILASFDGEKGVYSKDITEDLQVAGATGSGTTFSLDALTVPGKIAVGYGQHLFVLDGGENVRVRDIGERITGFVSRPGSGEGWILLLERGCIFVNFDLRSETLIDDDMECPKGVVTGGGQLVLLGDNRGKVFSWRGSTPVADGRFVLTTSEVLTVMSTPHPREFAMVRGDGHIQRWQMTD